MSLPNFMAWALRYAERGLEVFPLAPKDKLPAIPSAHPVGDPLRNVCRGECGKDGHGMLDATRDPERIRAWWKKYPSANIGVRVPEGVVVVDFDTWEALESCLTNPQQYPMPETLTAKTGRGRHVWFRVNVPVRQRPRILPDVDVRTRDGYVVAPPSLHPSGSAYEWEGSVPKGEDLLALMAEAPEWLVRKIAVEASPVRERQPGEDDDAPRGEAERLTDRIFAGAQEGERNDLFFRYAAKLRGLGLDRREAELLLWHHFQRAAPGGFTEREVLTCLDSAWRYAPEAAKKAAAERVEEDRDEGISIEQLMATHYPPMRWLVDGLITDGLTVLAASPKIGKSWFCLDLAMSVSSGQKILGNYPTERGSVLYLDLEQPPRKTQARIQKMSVDSFGNSRVPEGGWRGVHFFHRWPKLDQGGMEKLDRWLKAHPETRLVVVDVLAKIKAQLSGKGNIYDEGYRWYSELKQVFDTHRVAGIAVTHDRKATEGDQVDRVHGDRSLVGAADAVLVLSRRRGEKTGILFATGREIEDRNMELVFDPILAQWTVSDAFFQCPHTDTRREHGNKVCLKCGEIVTEGRDEFAA